MLKKLVLLTCISLNCLSARDYETETGDYSGALKPVKSLMLESDQVALGNLILLLKQVHKLKANNDSQWIQGFDAVYRLLQEINEKQTLQCRELALTITKKYEFEKLWTARYSLSGVVHDNLDTIAGTLPALIQFFGAAGTLCSIYELNGALTKKNIYVTTVGNHRLPFEAAPTNGNDIVLRAIDDNNIRIDRLKFSVPTKREALAGITAVLATQFKPNKFPQYPKTQFLLFAAACFAGFSQAKDRDISSPYIVVAKNGAVSLLTGIQIAQSISTVLGDWRKPCPLAQMMEKLKKDQREQEEEEEEENDDSEQPQARPVSNNQAYDSGFLKEMIEKSPFNKPYQADKDDKEDDKLSKEDKEFSEKFDKLAAKYKEKPPFHS